MLYSERMLKSVLYLIVALGLASCASSQTAAPTPDAQALQAEGQARPGATGDALDGLVVPGHIKARGAIGVFSVPGTVSFQEGMLVWTAQGTHDVGPYMISQRDGTIAFTARHGLENAEHVFWRGFSDGETLYDVTAVWTRQEGDLVHDALLPKQVTLDFKPSD